MTGYVRVDTGNNIADGNVISAADLDNEFDGVQSAFNVSTGHTHGGAAGEGAPITKLGPTQDVTASSSLLAPKTTNTVDVGSSSLKFKDLYLAGNASIGGTLAVTGATTLSAALTYGGVTLSNAVTGTGNMVLSASPTLTGTLSGANASLSGTLAVTGVATLTAQPILSSLTASRAVFTDASKGLVSNAITGTGNVVMSDSPTLVTPALGTPSSGTVTNLTGTASININGTVGATTANTGAFTTLAASGTTTLSGNQIISVTDNTNAALRITQLGTGNALLVEDSANPDSTPFAITATGAVLVGTTTAKTTGVGSAVMQIFGGTAPLSFYREADSTTAINVEFAKARAAGAILNSGDTIGRLYFSGSDGTAQIPAAYIDAAVDGTPGTNDMPGRLVFSTTADGASSPTERMRIDSSGQVKIGGTSLTNSYVSIQGASRAVTVSQAALRNDVTWDATVATSSISGYQNTHDLSATGAVTSGYGFWDQTFATQGATITNYYSFFASAQTAATNNYGFYSNIAAATGRWNFYAAGTAENYFAGQAQFADGSAATPSISNIGDENTGIFFPAADTIAFAEGGVEAMRIDSSGNLGLGVTPSAWASGQGAMQFKAGGLSAWALGGLNGYLYSNAYYDGTNNRYANTGTACSYAINNATGVHAWFNAPSGAGGDVITFTQAMTLDASGNLGIGTSSPGYQLTLQNSGTPAIHLLKTATSDGWVRNIGNLDIAAASGGGSGQVISFSTGSNYASLTERARIDGSGNLLVGTTSSNPVASRVNGAVLSANGSIQSRSPSAFSYYGLSVTSGTHISFYTDNGTNFVTAGNIASNGANTSFNATSDYRLKNNIQPLTGALNRVSQLRPVTWTWKEGYGGTRPECEGFIAHELQEVCSLAVTGEKDAVDAEGNPQYQGIDTSFLVATLTAAIQELKAINDAQAQTITALTARVAALESN